MLSRNKNILLFLSIALLAFNTATIIPEITTISLSFWLRAVIAISLGIVPVTVVAIWCFSARTVGYRRFLSLPSREDLPIYFVPRITIIGLVCGLVLSFFMTYFSEIIFLGVIMLFASIFLLFFIGAMKPELGPIAFLILHPFLMFNQARLGWPFMDKVFNVAQQWLEINLFESAYIDFTLFAFIIGFILFMLVSKKGLPRTNLDFPIILFLIWTLVSMITANFPREGILSYAEKWIFPISLFYSAIMAANRPKGPREIALGLIFLIFISSLLTIQHAILAEEIVMEYGRERAKVIAVIGGQLGPWVVLTLPFIISILFKKWESIYIRLLAGGAFVLSLIMIFWEMQRAVLLSLALMLALNVILSGRKKKTIIIYVVGITIAFFFIDQIVSIIELSRAGILSYTNPFAFSLNLDRTYLWEKAWEIIKNNPFLGIGPGGFRLLSIGFLMPEVSSHNMVLEVALESGIMAAILFIIIIFTPVFRSITSIFRGSLSPSAFDSRPWIISLLGYYALLMTHTAWEWGYGNAVFCLLGIIVGMEQKSRAK